MHYDNKHERIAAKFSIRKAANGWQLEVTHKRIDSEYSIREDTLIANDKAELIEHIADHVGLSELEIKSVIALLKVMSARVHAEAEALAKEQSSQEVPPATPDNDNIPF